MHLVLSCFMLSLLVVSVTANDIPHKKIQQSTCEYDEDLAHTAALYSAAAYCDPVDVALWNCTICSQLPSFHFVAPMYAPLIHTYGYIGFDTQLMSIVVAFRGTESSDLMNWVLDLSFASLTPWDTKKLPGVQVHAGFFSGYKPLGLELFVPLKELLKTLPNNYTVLFTGHSLGASLATLAAVDMLSNIVGKLHSDYHNNVTLITFGEPRTGNRAFAEYVSSQMTSTPSTNWCVWRVVHNFDIVPHLPTLGMGFWHVPTEIWYLETDQQPLIYTCNLGPNPLGSEQQNCSDSVEIPWIGDHLYYLGFPISQSCCAQKFRCPVGQWGLCCDMDCPANQKCINGDCVQQDATCPAYANPCVFGYWGRNQMNLPICDAKCLPENHCERGSCIWADSSCANDGRPCADGWWGCVDDIFYCNNSCPPDHHCFKYGTCMANDGSCNNDGRPCADGWWGMDSEGVFWCNNPCSPKHHCYGPCMANDGSCNADGRPCEDGWWGMDSEGVFWCNNPCSPKHHCYGPCMATDGSCNADGRPCADGWWGMDSEGVYWCNNPCSGCALCNPANGTC